MKERIRKLKERKYLATIALSLLFVFVFGLFSILNPEIKNIKINNISSKTSSLNASVIDGVSEGVISNNYDEIKYQIKVNKDAEDTAVIIATLTDEEAKYARFKEIKNSEVSENGKKITITTTDEKTNIIVTVENAPYGTTINPKIKINSEEETKKNINVEPVTITGKSVEGTIKDEEGRLYPGLELSLVKNDEEIKRTYTKETGQYVFSLGDTDSYEVKLEEEKYKILRYEESTTDENRRVLNIVVQEVEPFKANINKTISKLDLVINGKKETYSYADETKVVRSVKNAKTIEGSIYYNISVKNDGEIKGTLTVLKDKIPEGMSFDENKNPGWTKNGKYLFYTPLEDKEIGAFEKINVTLVLDIVKTNEAKNYLNTAMANGEDYKYIVYYLNNSIFREEYVINSEKVENIDPGIEDFEGWYTDKEYTNKYDFNNKATKDLILFGKIKNNKYTVTFIDVNPNTGVETIIEIKEIEDGSSASLPNAPQYSGYTFECYKLHDSCYEGNTISENLNLYTSYKTTKYNISYNLDGGQVSGNPIAYTVKDEIVLNSPSKTGYTFLGWTGTDLSEPTKNVTIAKGSTGNREYTANYQKIKSTLTVNPNGGIYNNNSGLTYLVNDYGTIISLDTPVKEGYTFTGWTLTGDGTLSGNTYTYSDEDGEISANYTPKTYTITYNLNGGDVSGNPESYTIESNDITLNNPSKTGYTFLGWTWEGQDTPTSVTIAKGSTGNRTYTANFEIDKYTLTVNPNGGTYNNIAGLTYLINDYGTVITLDTPEREGYTFTGWTLDGDGSLSNNIYTYETGNGTVTANYTPKTYTITYNLDGGQVSGNPESYTIESDDITLNNPSKTGYTFLGWTWEGQDTPTSVTIAKGSTGNKTYTANFEIDKYTLTVNPNGGTYNNISGLTYLINDYGTVITLDTPEREGYTFTGWTLDGDGSLSNNIYTYETGNGTVTANYTIDTYNITYDGLTDEEKDSLNLPISYTIEDEIILPTPSNRLDDDGDIFERFTGWTIDGTTSLDGIIPLGSTGSKAIVANFTHVDPDTYTITYILNGGDVSGNPESYTKKTDTFTLNNPSKEGYKFAGWTGTDLSEPTKTVTIPRLSTGNREYTANYTAIDYTINYELEGGTASGNPGTYTIESDDITLNNPSKEGYTFIGWTWEGQNTPTTVTIPKGSLGNRTYIANYSSVEYTITYNTNGGQVSGNPESYTIESDDIVIKNPTKEGYRFTGWTGSNGDTPESVTIPKGSTGNKEYTANYELIEYTITYNLNGGTASGNPETYTIESGDITLNNPSKEGYEFVGWTWEGQNTPTTVTIPKGSTGNRTYTANYSSVEYTITYELNGGSATGNPGTYTIESDDITLNNPSKEGYTFTGWTWEGQETPTKNVTISKGSTGNKIYTANYEIINYTITYKGLTPEEIDNLNNPDSYNIETDTFSLNIPTRTGYTFLGWTWTGQTTPVNVTITKGSAGNKEYTANFSDLVYDIDYTLNGGSLESGKTNPIHYSVESPDITLNNPSKEGYTFVGWSGTDLVGNNKNVTIPTGSIGNRSYEANYTPIEYSITYDYDGGSLESGKTNPSTYTIESEEITFNNPVKEGYIFTHYTMNNVIVTSIPTGSTGNKNLKANYEIRKYDVKYYNGNNQYSIEQVNYNSNATAPVINPTKAHNIFLYWSLDGINEFDFNTPITDDTNLYAVYEEVETPEISLSPELNQETNKYWTCNDSSDNNCGVTLTLISSHNDYELYYKIGDGAATLYTEPVKVYENTTITAFAKKSGVYSTDTSKTVNNIDTINPVINTPQTGSTSFDITVSGTTSDSGSGVKKVTLHLKEKNDLNYDDNYTYETDIYDGVDGQSESYTHTFYGLNDGSTYTVKIVSEDYVGNITEREVDIDTNPYGARIVGRNGILWYTIDPDTKEVIIDEGKDFEYYENVQDAIDACGNVECTIQTNPIDPVVNENLLIASNQNITIDLDGRGITSSSNATIVNNGNLTIVDRNPRLNDQNEHDSIGFVNNTTGKAIINNGTFTLGEGNSEKAIEFVFPEMDRPIIEGKTNALEQNNTFYFYDGKFISEDTVVTGNGEDAITQYMYNAIFSEENDKNVAILDKATDPEAKIKSTYYAKLKISDNVNAVDSAKKGTVGTEEARFLSKIKQYSEYGFIYDSINDEIYSGNQTTSNTTAISYIKLDLTSETEDKYIVFDTFIDTYNTNSYGYISVSNTLSNTGTDIYRTTGNNTTGTKLHRFEKGKVYYIYFGFVKGGGDINTYEVFKVTNVQLLDEKEETTDVVMYNDVDNYSFEKQDDGSYKSSNYRVDNSYAHSYLIFDLREETDRVNLLVNYDIDSRENRQYGYVYVSNDETLQNHNVTDGRFIYETGSKNNQVGIVELTPGKINYVHFVYYKTAGYHNTIDAFIINYFSLISTTKSSNVIPNTSITNDGNYNFEKSNYELGTIKDSSSYDRTLDVYGVLQNSSKNGFNFTGYNYARITTDMTNSLLTSETVKLTFSTNNRNNQVIYNGGRYNNIGIGILNGNVVVANRNINPYVYEIPSNFDDGNPHTISVVFENSQYTAYFDNVAMTKKTTRNNLGYTLETYLGRRSGGQYFVGTIYDIKVYNYALSEEELVSDTSTEGLLLHIDGVNSVVPADHNIYISNNYHAPNSTAHSYLTYDLTNVNEDKFLYVNTMISSQQNADFGYVQVSDSTDIPTDTTRSNISVSGDYDNQSSIIRLKKNQVNYVHFIYKKDGGRDDYNDRFIIKELQFFDTIEDAYSVNYDDYSRVDTYYFEKPTLNNSVDTIQLLKNVTINTPIVIPEEQEVILDLNGNTLSSSYPDYIIKNNGKIKVTDSEYSERHNRNVDYKLEQARLYEEAKSRYLADLAEYNEYAGLCDGCPPSDHYLLDQSLIQNFDYSGDSIEFNPTYNGKYKIELWGASGGDSWTSAGGNGYCEGGKGAYTSGTIELTTSTPLYIFVGEKGASGGQGLGVKDSSYNGGGFGGSGGGDDNAGSGGGATDIRLVDGSFDDGNSLNSRIMVAAGGGGSSCINNSRYTDVEFRNGGGLSISPITVASWNSSCNITGLTQTSGNSFGIGRNAPANETGHAAGGGGGGYYGGTYCNNGNFYSAGSGGISYISGHLGCVAVESENSTAARLDSSEEVCTDETALTDVKCSYHYSGKKFTDTQMISGSNEMPTYDGLDVMSGNVGDGHAKISYLITDEEYSSLIEDLDKKYNVRKKPVFKDYLDDIDFDGTVNINSLTPEEDVSFNNIVSDDNKGFIKTTIENAILNEEHATFNLETCVINVDVDNKVGIVNRGNLIVSNGAIINANNNNTIGINNETKGSVVFNDAVINANGESSTGLINRSNTTLISGVKVVTDKSSTTGINDQAIDDVTYSNLNISGSGTGFTMFNGGDSVITNSVIKSTNNNSFYTVGDGKANKLVINNSNFYGQFFINRTPKIISVNNSNLTTINNQLGNINLNTSTFNKITNKGIATINNSIINSDETAIDNYATPRVDGQQYTARISVKGTTINSSADTATNVISNNGIMNVKNITVNNTNGVKSTVFSNITPVSEEEAYLTIDGNASIDESFGTAINNTGVLTLGSNKSNTGEEYVYSYTGHQEEFVAPETGNYKLETWGASGAESPYDYGAIKFSHGGYGAYASGTIHLNEGDKLYIHVGGIGAVGTREYLQDGYDNYELISYYGSYNGGGSSPSNLNVIGYYGTGGGATDISLSSEDNKWYYDNGIVTNKRSNSSYEQRLVVAGGGSGGDRNSTTKYGGYNIDSSTSQLGFGSRGGGGGYYGGTYGYGGSSYVSNSLSDRITKMGSEEMPDYESAGNIRGNLGNGYAKITLLDGSNDTVKNAPEISATDYGITGNGTINYYDGIISANKAINTYINEVAEDYDIYLSSGNNVTEKVTLVKNSDTRPVSQGETYVATIGNTKYTTIQNAIDAASNGDEIDLLVDVNQQNIVTIPDNKNLTIDYNGHTVTTYNNETLFHNIHEEEGSSVTTGTTIKDSVKRYDNNYWYGEKYIINDGKLNVEELQFYDQVTSSGFVDNNGELVFDKVRIYFGYNNDSNGLYAVNNNSSGNLTINNSNLYLQAGKKNNSISSFAYNNGSLTIYNSTLSYSDNVINRQTLYFVTNNSGTVILDKIVNNVVSRKNDITYYLANNKAELTIRNSNSLSMEKVINTGVINLTNNTISSGTLDCTENGLTIVNSGTYSNVFNIGGTGRINDNTDKLYSFIMNNGTINTTLNITSSGISHIKNGTISVTNGNAINNSGNGVIVLGNNDGFVDTKANTKPIITGSIYGIYTSNPNLLVDFYDGIVSGTNSYNVTINDIESGYSIKREYDTSTQKEIKYLASEPLFINKTQGITYNSIDDLNNALSNGSINNNDEIKLLRDLTITKSENAIVIPQGLKIIFNLDNHIVNKNNETMFIINGELDVRGDFDERIAEVYAELNAGTLELSQFVYYYKGDYQIFKAPANGTYKIEAWGAQGGNNNSSSGKGGYTSGEITLDKGDQLYIYVGGMGSSTTPGSSEYVAGGYNGGGSTNGQTYGDRTFGSGGGATDIRYFASTPSNNDLTVDSTKGLASRIMVAAGGGGGYMGNNGGAGGGLTGQIGQSRNNNKPGPGGTQTSGGINTGAEIANGSFGLGGSGGNSGMSTGGGGGYYGGAGSYHVDAAGGGSSYVSGYTGSVAITSESNITPKSGCDNGTTDQSCSVHYSGKVFASPVIKAGNEEMPSNTDNSTMTGKQGNGYVRITEVSTSGDKEYSLEDAVSYLILNGEYDPDETEYNISKIDSTIGDIFVNNGILNILSGHYISERDSKDTTIVKNNNGATLNITDGHFTKFYDKLDELTQYDRGYGSIVNNSGTVNVNGGEYLINSSYSNKLYTSNIFYNNSTGVINATNIKMDGFASVDVNNDKTYSSTISRASKGQVFNNSGTLNISNSTSHNSLIGINTGTVVLENVDMDNISYIGDYRSNENKKPIVNSGTFTVKGGKYNTLFYFVNNSGEFIITKDSSNKGTRITRTGNGLSYINDTLRIIYNDGSGNIDINGASILSDNVTESTIINNVSTGYVKVSNSTLTTKNYPTITNTSTGTVEVYDGSTLTATNKDVINNTGAGNVIVYGNGTTVTSGSGIGINNTGTGTITVGVHDSSVSPKESTYPIITGSTYGIVNTKGTFNFYDGLLRGKTAAKSGSYTNVETNYSPVEPHVKVDDYYEAYLDRIYIIQNANDSTKKYYSLKEAFDAANDGDEFKMIANYSTTIDIETAVVDNNIVLDLNGFTVTQGNDVLIRNNGTFTIKDNSNNKTGAIVSTYGTVMLNNYGTLNVIGGNISTNNSKLLFNNNIGGILTIKDYAKIDSSTGSVLIDNSGTLNILNGAYLHNVSGNMIINKNVLNITDLNNNDDSNTSSQLKAPWIYSENNDYDDYSRSSIKTESGSVTTIYGGIYNNGETFDNNGSPSKNYILYNLGNTTIKNLNNYSYSIGYNSGTLRIENSHFYNFQDFAFRNDGTTTFKNTQINVTGTYGYRDHHRIINNGILNFDTVNVSMRSIDPQTFEIGDGSFVRDGRIPNASKTININDSTIAFNTNSSDYIFSVSKLNMVNSTLITNKQALNLSVRGEIDSSTITSTETSITNSGDLILKNNTNITSTNNNSINNTGTLDVLDSVNIISQNGFGILLDSNGTVNLGEIGGEPSKLSPYIEGTTFGISNNSSNLNFYDGLVVGQTGSDAIYGAVSYVEGGYETVSNAVTDPDTGVTKYNEYLVASSSSVTIAQVGTYLFSANSSISSSKALQKAINFAIGDGTNIRDVDLIANVDLTVDELSITASDPITINLNGHTITQNSTYYLSSNITLNNSNNLSGSVSKLLGNVFNTSNNSKDIVIYELSDASKLDTTKTYKLYKDGKVLKLEKLEFGKYKYQGNNENLIPIKGRLYIDNLSSGSYKLESNDNKYIEFSIDEDGNIIGNVTENINNKSSDSVSESNAELILTIQTGIKRHYYLLLIIPITILIITMIVFVKRNKEREI